MGIGNLQDVLRAYGRGRAPSYAAGLLRLDAATATPPCSAGSPRFGDDSSNYLWKLDAARGDHAPVPRSDPARARAPRRRCRPRRTPPRRCCTRRTTTPRFADARRRCEAAWDDDDIRAFPNEPRRDRARARPAHGRARRRGSAPRRASTAACGPRRSRWRSTSARRCARTRRRRAADRHLDRARRGATSACSCAATARRRATTRCTRPAGRSTSRAPTARARQALAFQFVLDRLQVLDVIAWVREPGAIHVTASPRRRGAAAAARADPLTARPRARSPGSAAASATTASAAGRAGRRARLVGGARGAVGVAAARGRCLSARPSASRARRGSSLSERQVGPIDARHVDVEARELAARRRSRRRPPRASRS